ncbi:MAG: hypothetical protein WAX07_02110, partial [Candidatus Altiarchaeia archaeon]
CRGDNARCSGTVASCGCSGSGTSYSCLSCADTFGACGEATCSSYACGNSAYATGTDCGSVCESCNGAGACIDTASGGDYQNECPGSYGTCAGASCNGAGACGYLAAGKQGCGTCQGCSGSGFACAQVASGSDTYGECPGSFGACAGANCNGASACQYLSAGKQGCGTCQGCSGSSFGCSYVAADADTYGDCAGNCDECNGAGACRGDNARCSGTVASCGCSGSSTSYSCQTCPDTFGACGDATCSSYACGNSAYATGTDCGSVCQSCNGVGNCVNTASGSDYQNECAASWNGCSGSCVKTGPNGNCNGAGACNSGGGSAVVAAANICSGGSEVAGVCNAAYGCTNAQNTDNAYGNGGTPYWTQGYCDGGGSCDRSGSTLGDGDGGSAACQCIKAASGYWGIGGEVAGTTCCSDDAGENKRTRVCSSGCTTDGADDACCDSSTDCVYSSACYANAALYSNWKCNGGSWTTTTTIVVTPTTNAPDCSRSVSTGNSNHGSCPSSCDLDFYSCNNGVCCNMMMECGYGTKCWGDKKSRKYTGACGANTYQICWMEEWYADKCMPCTSDSQCNPSGGISCQNGYCCDPAGCGYNCGCYKTGNIVLKSDGHYYRCNMEVWDLYL